jgi:hypothetical protein
LPLPLAGLPWHRYSTPMCSAIRFGNVFMPIKFIIGLEPNEIILEKFDIVIFTLYNKTDNY